MKLLNSDGRIPHFLKRFFCVWLFRCWHFCRENLSYCSSRDFAQKEISRAGIIVVDPYTVNPLLSPPSGASLFQTHLRGGLIEAASLFNVAKMMVSVPHKELECRDWVEKFKYNRKQIRNSSWWINRPRSVHTKFYSFTVYHLWKVWTQESITRSITRVYNTINWRDTTHFDSEDDYRTGCRNVSHCQQQQQSYSGLRSPGRSNSTNFWERAGGA